MNKLYNNSLPALLKNNKPNCNFNKVLNNNVPIIQSFDSSILNKMNNKPSEVENLNTIFNYELTAVPKKRRSLFKRKSRFRSITTIKFNQSITTCSNCGNFKVPHNLCSYCYFGKLTSNS
eukprot:TRINITY_DN8628_c0_g1_i1.p1 TRINITY_DN8628_c0_g1~~TRINITY_DN8628_c0_g1_i1.p1  ORF type:complete len:120 (-),score=30.45 TRINITY_DN8628_c0_g1_i1:111-470(-)